MLERRKTSHQEMQSHFSRIASAYRDLRTTDIEPILFIKERLEGREHLKAADVGCGDGRYGLLLFHHLPNLHLTCVDINPKMLKEAESYFTANGFHNFETLVSSIENLSLKERSLDCIFTFNAVHHFDFNNFLQKAGTSIKRSGHLFIYTRLPDQNTRSIWGTHFPGFLEKETRLYELAYMEKCVCGSEHLNLEEVGRFRYSRVSSLDRLLCQAREKHYSTLFLYSSDEFEAAAERFAFNIRRSFPNPERIEWFDENIMLVLRRDPS